MKEEFDSNGWIKQEILEKKLRDRKTKVITIAQVDVKEARELLRKDGIEPNF